MSWRVFHENFLPFPSLQPVFVLYVQNAGSEQVFCPSTSTLRRVWKMQWLVCVLYFFIYFYLEGWLQISCVAPCPVSLVIILRERSAGCRVLFWVGFQESTLSCSPHSAFKNSLIVQLFFSYVFVRLPPISPCSGKCKTLVLFHVWTGFYTLWNSV